MEFNLKPSNPVDFCIDELYKVNEWYGKIRKDMPSIVLLTSARTRCVTLLTTLAVYVAEAKGEMKEKESQYEFSFNKINLAYLQADNTIPMAKAKTMQDLTELKQQYLNSYKYFTSLDYFYNKMSAVAESMSQDIATIKDEKRQTQRA